MENASKALLIAGGILIALIIIALLVRSFTTIGLFKQAQLSEEEQAKLINRKDENGKELGKVFLLSKEEVEKYILENGLYI